MTEEKKPKNIKKSGVFKTVGIAIIIFFIASLFILPDVFKMFQGKSVIEVNGRALLSATTEQRIVDYYMDLKEMYGGGEEIDEFQLNNIIRFLEFQVFYDIIKPALIEEVINNNGIRLPNKSLKELALKEYTKYKQQYEEINKVRFRQDKTIFAQQFKDAFLKANTEKIYRDGFLVSNLKVKDEFIQENLKTQIEYLVITDEFFAKEYSETAEISNEELEAYFVNVKNLFKKKIIAEKILFPDEERANYANKAFKTQNKEFNEDIFNSEEYKKQFADNESETNLNREKFLKIKEVELNDSSKDVFQTISNLSENAISNIINEGENFAIYKVKSFELKEFTELSSTDFLKLKERYIIGNMDIYGKSSEKKDDNPNEIENENNNANNEESEFEKFANSKFEEFKTKYTNDKSFKETAEELNINDVGITGYFTVYPDNIRDPDAKQVFVLPNYEDEFMKLAFTLPVGEMSNLNYSNSKNSFYSIKIVDRAIPEEQISEEDKEELFDTIYEEDVKKHLTDWYRLLEEKYNAHLDIRKLLRKYGAIK